MLDLELTLKDTPSSTEMEFVGSYLLLIGGISVFTYLCQVDSENYIMKDPLMVVPQANATVDSPKCVVTPYCPFSADAFTLIKRSHIISMNMLDEEHLKFYEGVLKKYSQASIDDVPSGHVLH